MSTTTILREKTGDSNGRNDDGGRSKTRVGQACARCRSRKDRCDGLRPSCTTCRNADQPCSYEPSTKKRGLPEGYVRSIEKLLGMFIDKIDGFEDVASQMLQNHGHVLRKAWNNSPLGEELHLSWKDSRLLQELEILLSQPNQTTDQPPAGSKRKRDEEDGTDTDDTETSFPLAIEYSISRLNADAPSSQLQHTIPQPPSLPPSARQLLDHYFVHTHCYFPVVTRPLLLKTFYDSSTNPQYVEKDRGALSLLWAILAYTSQQVAPLNQMSIRTGSSQLSPQILRGIARHLLFEDMQSHTVLHAKAFLIHTLLDIGLNDWSSAWKSVGHATRIVLDLGHAAAATTKQSLSATLQGCFILDTIISIHNRLRPHLRSKDVEDFGLVNEDGHEEWEPWTSGSLNGGGEPSEPSFSMSCFNRLTQIFSVISDVMFPPLQQSFAGWSGGTQSPFYQLSALRNSFPFQREPNERTPPHQIYLQIFYMYAQALLLKLDVDRAKNVGDRAQGAFQIFRLVEICRTAPAIGLENIPPLFADCLRLATELASSEAACFEPQYGLPSYQEMINTSAMYGSHLGKVWPLFAGGADSKTTQVTSQNTRHNIDWDRPNTNSYTGDRVIAAELSQPRRTLPPTWEVAQSAAVPSMPDLNGWQLPTNNTAPTIASTPQQGNPPPPYYAGTAGGSMSSSDAAPIEMNTTIEPIFATDVPVTGTSPGFQGDKIDAIFHEMAYLDTNEWNLERAVGLKDFGFNDDLTFQAFCNDPERLVIRPSSTNDIQQQQSAAVSMSNLVGASGLSSRGNGDDGPLRTFSTNSNPSMVVGRAGERGHDQLSFMETEPS